MTETGSRKASASEVSVNDTMCVSFTQQVLPSSACPRRPIVARGRADWLSERGLFRIRFRNASLLLMLRLAKMFEKHSKHMEGNYWAPSPPTPQFSNCRALCSASDDRVLTVSNPSVGSDGSVSVAGSKLGASSFTPHES